MDRKYERTSKLHRKMIEGRKKDGKKGYGGKKKKKKEGKNKDKKSGSESFTRWLVGREGREALHPCSSTQFFHPHCLSVQKGQNVGLRKKCSGVPIT